MKVVRVPGRGVPCSPMSLGRVWQRTRRPEEGGGGLEREPAQTEVGCLRVGPAHPCPGFLGTRFAVACACGARGDRAQGSTPPGLPSRPSATCAVVPLPESVTPAVSLPDILVGLSNVFISYIK